MSLSGKAHVTYRKSTIWLWEKIMITFPHLSNHTTQKQTTVITDPVCHITFFFFFPPVFKHFLDWVFKHTLDASVWVLLAIWGILEQMFIYSCISVLRNIFMSRISSKGHCFVQYSQLHDSHRLTLTYLLPSTCICRLLSPNNTEQLEMGCNLPSGDVQIRRRIQDK